MKQLLALSCLCFLLAQATQEIRVDLFDRKSNRTGYLVIDPRSGRVDQFDRRSNRLGYGTVTSPLSSTPSGESSRSVPPDRRTTR